MTIITCKGMLSEGLTYDNYKYKSIGQFLAIIIVVVPLALIILYVPYRIYVTSGSFSQVLFTARLAINLILK